MKLLIILFFPLYCYGQFDTLRFIDGSSKILKGDTLLPYTKSHGNPNSFMIVEEGAVFPGGSAGFYKYLEANLNVPDSVVRSKVGGNVKVTFTIDKRGLVKNIVCTGDTTLGRGIEARRLIANMPRWKPAFQRGLAKPMRMALPISFNIKDQKK